MPSHTHHEFVYHKPNQLGLLLRAKNSILLQRLISLQNEICLPLDRG